MFDAVYRPGIALGTYPERGDSRREPLEAVLHGMLGRLRRSSARGPREGLRFVAAVEALADEFRALDEAAFRAACVGVREALQQRGYDMETTVRAFAAVREASGRILGKRHFHTQLLGGWALLKGRIAEMQTGEGKTITTLLPACTAAMAGVPVHVITANDYLAARDAETLAPVYAFFGLTVGVLTDEVQAPAERRAAYRSNLTYCAPRQVAFDYLRDRMTMGHRRGGIDHKVRALTGGDADGDALLMRGLCFAIVDEADSVLVDDACTPLILSAQSGEAPDGTVYEWAIGIARGLGRTSDYRIDTKYREVTLTASGRERVAELTQADPGPAANERERELLVGQALQALHCYLRDRDYLVREGKIEIIDANTGRAQPDTAWERGLHQMVETKEGCELTPPRRTIARMSYQRFFRRYLHLSGMSGTVREVRHELWSVYRLQVVGIPTFRKSRRVALGETIHRSLERKWKAIAARAAALQHDGRAVLIGTQSVEESEALGAALGAAGVDYVILNARQDKAEAEIVARAGQAGAVTVATNMAGRGTDIELPREVKASGGLHVIVAGRNDSARVDRQLVGRCARQGDPGSWQAILSLEDDLLKKQLPGPLLDLSGRLDACGVRWAGRFATWLAQRLAERQGLAQRRGVLRFDEQSKERLAFSGPME